MKGKPFGKFTYLWLLLCIISILSVFACSSPTPSATQPPAKSVVTPTTPAAVTPKTSTTAVLTPAVPSSSPSNTVSQPNQPQLGGSLNILATGIPSENLGFTATPVPRWQSMLPWSCVELLINQTNTGSFKGCLATDWKWSTDNKSVTMTLQKGVKFHDGTDFNAAAAKYCLDLVKNSTRAELKDVSSIEVVDDYTLKINMKAYDNVMLSDLAIMAGAMFSPTALQKFDMNYNVANPVGTGPFKFVSWQRDVSLKYTKNTDYWQKGKPYLDNIQYTFVADPSTARTAFLAGGNQIIGTMSPTDADQLTKSGNVVIGSSPGALIAFAPDGANANSPFSKLEVRQAVAYAVDTKALIQNLGSAYLIPTNQPVPSTLYSYNPDVKGYPFDPQKAKDLLKTAGYPNGFETTIYYQSGYSDIAKACLAAQQYLREVGIIVTLQQSTAVQMTDLQSKGWKNGLITVMGTIGYSPVNTIKRNWSTQTTMQVSLLHPEPVESLLKQAIIEPDQSKFTKDLQQINKMMIDDYCTMIPLYCRTSLFGAVPNVKNAGWIMGNDVSASAADTWLSK